MTKEKMTINLVLPIEVKKFIKVQSALNEKPIYDYVSDLLTKEFKKNQKK